jgi:hypothetical protein
MRKLAIVLAVAFLAPVPAARAENTTSYQVPTRTHSTSEVLSVLGKKNTPAPAAVNFPIADVGAGISTGVSCGKLRVNFQFREMVDKAKRLPKQLAGQATALINALPMLILCQSSPSLCAEIKNINYQINEEMKVLSDVCRSMDTFIDKKAHEGQARGWKKCVHDNYNGKEESDGNLANAQMDCNESDPAPLYTDIAKGWVEENVRGGEQRVLGGMLEAVGKKAAGDERGDRYQFMSAILGELKLSVNGKVLPTLPAGMQPSDVKNLAKGVGGFAVRLACDSGALEQAGPGPSTSPRTSPRTSTSSTPAEKFWQDRVYEVVFEQIDASTVRNLRDLNATDHDSACNALGRAMARQGLDNLSLEIAGTMAQALQNPALDADLRQAYAERTTLVVGAINEQKQRYDGSQKKVADLLPIINRMAAIAREENGRAGAAFSRGQDRMKERSTFRCESADTCE